MLLSIAAYMLFGAFLGGIFEGWHRLPRVGNGDLVLWSLVWPLPVTWRLGEWLGTYAEDLLS